MGGGDLNSKKSWHPNTMKNQERVWKAEQAAAEEKKRIEELQHERAAERDRTQLNELAQRSAGGGDNDSRLHWMYDKPDKKAHHEDYLLGKAIEKNYGQPAKSDDVIPAVARRIVGSSMLMSTEDSQVDLARKMKEDPLLLVKERERAARAALLNNPIHRKRITALLRKEQEEKKERKQNKLKKKDNLDNVLAAKLNALGGDKGLDIAALLASDDSSSSPDSDEGDNKKKKKKKKVEKKKPKKTKKKKKIKSSESDCSDNEKITKLKKKTRDMKDIKLNKSSRETDSEDKKKYKHKSPQKYIRQNVTENRDKSYRETRKRKSDSSDSDRDIKNKRNRRDSSGDSRQRYDSRKVVRRRSRSDDSDKQSKIKQSRRDSSCDRNQRNISRKDATQRSESHDPDKDTRNRKYSRQNSNERRCNKPDYSSRRRRDSSGDRKDEVKSRRRSLDRSRGTGEPMRSFPEQSKGREDVKWKGKKNVLSEQERAAKLAEMAAAGVEREVQRGLRVAAQLASQQEEDRAPRRPRGTHNEARALPDSLESRIHSNRHYIQRDKRHMNEHFARR